MSSKIVDFLFGYESSNENFEKSLISRAEKKFSDKIISGIGSVYIKKTVNSPLSKLIGRITSSFAHTTINAYGSAFLAFGLVTLLINFANYYFGGFVNTPLSDLITGAVFAIIAVPMLFIDKPLCDVTEQVGFIELFLHDTLCIKRASRHYKGVHGIPIPVVVFFGIVPAVIGFFIPLYSILIPILVAVLFVLAIFSPEFSFMLTLLCIPILPLIPHSSTVLVCAIGVTVFSFFIKVLLGKRVYHFEQYDALIILFSLFILVSGIFNKGFESFENSLLMIVLIIGYTLANNLIVNRRLADNAVNIILFSSLPTAIFGIIGYFIAPAHPEWFDERFSEIGSRAVATFGNPNIYSVFLIISIVFSIAYGLDKKRGSARIYYLTVALLNLVAITLTWTRGAWVALILSAFAYLIINAKKIPKLLLIPLSLIPVGLSFIPSAFIDRLLSIFNTADSSVSVRLSTWRSSLLMLKDHLFTGVGMGEKSFTEEFLKYAEDAVTSPHSHNLFLEIACQAGIFALLIFGFIFIVRIQHIATYRRYIGSSSISSPITMTGIATFALIAFGMTDYIFYNSSMCFLFWVVFGIGSATLRISKNEHDEKLGYNSYTSISVAASKDIKVSE